jgi:hypothetical protein
MALLQSSGQKGGKGGGTEAEKASETSFLKKNHWTMNKAQKKYSSRW